MGMLCVSRKRILAAIVWKAVFSSVQTYAIVHGRHAIGDLRKVIVTAGDQGPKESGCSDAFLDWLTDPVLNGGGALTDFGCYGADLITWFMNGQRPDSVFAVAQHIKPEVYTKVEDEATIIFQRQQRGLAVVLDEFGGTAGIVTTEDILEELIGHIRSEVETEGFLMEKLGPGRWRVAGTLRLDDFRREYPLLGGVPEVETMGGLLMCLLDVVPKPGDAANFRGLRLTAKTADERRVRELMVETVK